MHRQFNEELIEQVSKFATALQQYPAKGLHAGIGCSLTNEGLTALTETIRDKRTDLKITAPYKELLSLYVAYSPVMDLMYAATCSSTEEDVLVEYILENLARGRSPLRKITIRLFGRALKASKAEDALYRLDVAFLSEVLAYATDKECTKVSVKKDGRFLKKQEEANVYIDGGKDLEAFRMRVKKAVSTYSLILDRLRKKEGVRDAELYSDLAHVGALVYDNTAYISIPVMPSSKRAVWQEAILAYNSAKKKYSNRCKAAKEYSKGTPAYNRLMDEAEVLKEELNKAESKGGLKEKYLAAQKPYAAAAEALGYTPFVKGSTYYVRVPRVLGSLDAVIGEDSEGNPLTGHDRVSSEYTDHRDAFCEHVRELGSDDFFSLMAFVSGAHKAADSARALYKGFTGIKLKANEFGDTTQMMFAKLKLGDGATMSASDIVEAVLANGRDVALNIFKTLSNNIAVENEKKHLDEEMLRKVIRSELHIADAKGHYSDNIDWAEYGRRLKLDADEYNYLIKMAGFIMSYQAEHTKEQRSKYAQQVAEYKDALNKARIAEKRSKKENCATEVQFPAALPQEVQRYEFYTRTYKKRKELLSNRSKYADRYVGFLTIQLKRKIK